jgi:predicted ABC-type ATPase
MDHPITIYNIRGPNGSGKSTLARSLIAGDPAAEPNRPGVEGSPTMVDLAWFDSPTKKDPTRRRSVEGYVTKADDLEAIVVGSYRTACGGLDATPNFATGFEAINGAVSLLNQHGSHTHRAVVAEGVISSTVWGSWGAYAEEMMETDTAVFAFCYVIPPLEVCLERIRERQRAAGGEKPIKEELVADKIKAVKATREKALEARHIVYDLPATLPAKEVAFALRGIISNGRWGHALARERFRA